MSYIWEDRNRDKSLFEMAMAAKAIVESETMQVSMKPEQSNEKALDVLKDYLTDKCGCTMIADTATSPYKVTVTAPNTETLDKLKKQKEFRMFCEVPMTDDERKANTNASISGVLKALNIPDDKKSELAISLLCVSKGLWLDGSTPNEKQRDIVERIKESLHGANAEEATRELMKIYAFTEKAGIHPEVGNHQLVKTDAKDRKITGTVQMPSMFDAEPDDSMWNDMVVTDFGMALVNLSHPAVNKIINSEAPEEECPGDLKAFKKAIYGDKRLTAVFGEGGIARMLGKLANLCTLGIAGATVDAGKRADRIIKELKEKGGVIAHRNPLLVKYDDIYDADANSDSTIPAFAYNRSKRTIIDGTVSIPCNALAEFYAPVDPVQSPKIYVEAYTALKGKVSDIFESAETDGEPLVEGPASFIAKQARKLQDKFTDGRADNPGENKPDKDATAKFVQKVQRDGHPPYYVLKPKTENKEVDTISTSKTGQAGTSGKAVHMVTMKIGEHKAATFMTPAEIKLYFSA